MPTCVSDLPKSKNNSISILQYFLKDLRDMIWALDMKCMPAAANHKPGRLRNGTTVYHVVSDIYVFHVALTNENEDLFPSNVVLTQCLHHRRLHAGTQCKKHRGKLRLTGESSSATSRIEGCDSLPHHVLETRMASQRIPQGAAAAIPVVNELGTAIDDDIPRDTSIP